MRIVTGCIEQETSTFTPVPTTRASFFQSSFLFTI